MGKNKGKWAEMHELLWDENQALRAELADARECVQGLRRTIERMSFSDRTTALAEAVKYAASHPTMDKERTVELAEKFAEFLTPPKPNRPAKRDRLIDQTINET